MKKMIEKEKLKVISDKKYSQSYDIVLKKIDK
ncbi:MAG: hypothetical protein ACTHW2_04320 [Tissierella sp.]